MVALASVLVTPELVRVEGGKVHLRFEVGGRKVDDPRCNLDDATRRSSITPELLEQVDPSELCSYCFGEN